MENRFKKTFDKYVCEYDTIEAALEGFDIVARIEGDEHSRRPDEDSESFWPSLDPKDAGFIGKGKTEEDLKKAKEAADKIMNAWRKQEWFYCGIVLSVSKNGIMLDKHAASLWGIEANYPESDNSYLTQTANELLDEAVDAGKRILKTLTGD